MHVLVRNFLLLVGGLLLASRLGAQVADKPDESARRNVMVSTYCSAWAEPERAKRDSLLRQVWASDGRYSDPTPISLKGRAALSSHIGSFLAQNAGVRFRCSAAESHHHFMRFAWAIVAAGGTTIVSGTDFAELASDGRLQRIVGFFGDPPKIPE